MRVCGSNNRFTNLCRPARGRQASYTRHTGETHLSVQCAKFHSSIYFRLTKHNRKSPSHPPLYLRVQWVFHFILSARFWSHLPGCWGAPASREVAEGLLESGGLLITDGSQQDWNLQFSIWQVLWQSMEQGNLLQHGCNNPLYNTTETWKTLHSLTVFTRALQNIK